MEKIIQQVAEWELMKKLPQEFVGFTLETELRTEGTQYLIFSYSNAQWHKRFALLYDKATKEFMVRITIGLMEFFDVEFIAVDLAMMETLLTGRLRKTLTKLAVCQREFLDSIVIDKQIPDWPYIQQLPQECAGFSLFISPAQPVRIINGSYIIIDYSDFSADSSLVIYYNIFRDEFFGEARLRKKPQVTALFDADSLEELQQKLQEHLEAALTDLRKQLN